MPSARGEFKTRKSRRPSLSTPAPTGSASITARSRGEYINCPRTHQRVERLRRGIGQRGSKLAYPGELLLLRLGPRFFKTSGRLPVWPSGLLPAPSDLPEELGVCVKCKRDARTATAQQSAFSWPQRCMPVRLRQKIQTLPRSAGRRVALGRPNPLCYPNSGPTASILFGCFNFLTICPSRPPSLDGQHHCLPGGWRSAPSLRTSSRLRESRYVPARTPSNCHHVIFEQVQEALVLESCRSTEVDCWQKRGTRSCGRGPRLAHSGERGGEDSDSARAVRRSPASDR